MLDPLDVMVAGNIYRALRQAGQGSLAHQHHVNDLQSWFMRNVEDVLAACAEKVGAPAPQPLEQNMTTAPPKAG
jgi:hypothetical protein